MAKNRSRFRKGVMISRKTGRSSYKRRHNYNIEIGKYDTDVLEYVYEKEFLNDYNIQITDFVLGIPIKFFGSIDIRAYDAYVYILRNHEKIIIYIGCSLAIGNRIKYHKYRDNTSFVDIFLVKLYEKAIILENILIKDFKPKLNRLIWNGYDK